MKKNLLITTFGVMSSLFLLLPSNVFAKTEVTSLDEATAEEINTFKNESSYADAVKELESYDLSNYEESNDKVNVYIFRGGTCSHCFEAIAHFASIYQESGKYFNVKTYEVWNNTDNNDLMKKVAENNGDEVSGVPYIVIGNKSWSGYDTQYDSQMMTKIKSEYNKSKNKRTDIVNDILGKKSTSNNTSSDILSVLIILLVAGGITYGIIMTRKKAN